MKTDKEKKKELGALVMIAAHLMGGTKESMESGFKWFKKVKKERGL